MRSTTDAADSALLLDDPVTAVGAVTDLLADETPVSLRQRRLTDSTVAALESRGLLRLAWPHGRYATHTNSAQAEVLTALAEIDGSLAWVAALYGTAPYLVTAIGDSAFDEFSSSTIPVATFTLATTGTASRTTGGRRVTGRWERCVGEHHAGWVVVPARQHAGPPQMLLIPRPEFGIEVTGEDAGLIAAGAQTLTLDDAFVPDHRTTALPALLDGTGAPDGSIAAGEYYRGPLLPKLCAALAAVPVGIARAVLAEVEDQIHYHAIPFGTGELVADSPLTHRRMHDAATALLHAETHLHRLTGTVDAHVQTGRPLTRDERARCRADLGEAARLSRRACELAVTGADPEALALGGPLAAALADVRAICADPFARHDTAVTAHGEVLCRRPVSTPYL